MAESVMERLEKRIEQYRSEHPDEAARADEVAKNMKLFGELEIPVFSIPQEGESQRWID